MRNLVFLMLIISFTSCATLVLKKDYEVQISSNISEAKAEIQDSIYDLPAEIRIKRSKEDLAIKLFNDSLEKDFVVKAAPNGTFLYANLIFSCPHGIHIRFWCVSLGIPLRLGVP